MSGKIDYRHVEKKEATEGKFPVEVESEYRVFINEKAYQTMKAHAGTTNEVEICGVLIGEVKRDGLGAFLLINATIEGKHANNHGAQVTFTHQTWEYINSIKDKEYPNQRIVGWYHTHPGFGVFLSKMDMFIQENFFHHPFQVAIVIETKKHEEGCFVWREGKSVPIRRYWVNKQEVKLVTGEVEEISMADMRKPSDAASVAPSPREREEEFRGGGLSFLHLLVMVLVFFCGFMFGKLMVWQEVGPAIGDKLESELYSMMEYAGMTALAGKDLMELKNRLGAAEEQLKKNDTAGATQTLGLTKNEIDMLVSTYEKHRSALRNELLKMSSMRQSLGDRITAIAQNQDQLFTIVIQLRLQELLAPEGKPIDLASLSEGRREVIRTTIDRIIRATPESKKAIEAMHPKALEVLFPAGDVKSGKSALSEPKDSKSAATPDEKRN